MSTQGKEVKEKSKSQYQARLDNQKSQLERHGNFAEVVIRTTPEGTDMINFARLWEHVLVVADRQTRGYIAKNSREDFEKTQKDFIDSVGAMAEKLKECIERHQVDLGGTNFISRIAQRYDIAERKKQKAAPAEKKPAAKKVAPKAEAPKKAEKKEASSVTPVPPESAEPADQVDGF